MALVVWLCFGLCLVVGLCFLVCLVVGGDVLFHLCSWCYVVLLLLWVWVHVGFWVAFLFVW